jgi:hypothetical protein
MTVSDRPLRAQSVYKCGSELMVGESGNWVVLRALPIRRKALNLAPNLGKISWSSQPSAVLARFA